MKKYHWLVLCICFSASGLFASSIIEGFEEAELGDQWVISYAFSGSELNTSVGPVTGTVHTGSQSLSVGCTENGEIAVNAIREFDEPLPEGDITVWHYDAFAGNSPYYTYIVVSSTNGQTMSNIQLRDRGWHDTGYRIYLEETGHSLAGIRSVGWHKFAFGIHDGIMTISVDGQTLASGSTTNSVGTIRLTHYSVNTGAYSSLFDDLSVGTDSDGDGLFDDQETDVYGTDPHKFDSDSDGLSDGAEINTYGTDPKLADSDSDGFNDKFEINTGFDPMLDTSTPDLLSTIQTAIEFKFNAANGVSYRIEAAENLTNTWETIETSIIGEGDVVDRLYSIEGQPKRFFRARRNAD